MTQWLWECYKQNITLAESDPLGSKCRHHLKDPKKEMKSISCRLIILDETGSACAKDISGNLPEVFLSREHHSWSKPIIKAVKEKYGLDIKILRTLSETQSTRTPVSYTHLTLPTILLV